MPKTDPVHYSRRLPADFAPNALSRALAAHRQGGAPLIDLTVTNPTEVGLSPDDASVRNWLDRPGAGRYAPDPAGLEEARAAVASYYADRGARIEPEQVLLTASTSEGYAHVFRALGDPGDSFLVPRPSYPLFEPLAALESVRLDPWPLRYDGRWWLDREALERAITPRTRGLILVEPNNPTGSCLSPEEAESADALAAARGLPLIVDEVFGDFVPGDVPRRPTWAAPGSAALTFVMSGLSKVCGLPQLKLGWIVVAGPEAARAEALARLEWVADMFLSVGTPVQNALGAILGARHAFQAAVTARVAENRATLAALAPAGGPLELLAGGGGWAAVLRVPRVRTEEEWCLALLRAGVLVHPGHFYDFEDEAWVVVSLLPEPGAFARGAGILREVVAAG